MLLVHVVREDVISMMGCVRFLVLYLLTVIKSYLSLGISAFGENGEASTDVGTWVLFYKW